ncbi:MAG: dipicolinate synthase subunit DpsA [Bacillota bacterium]
MDARLPGLKIAVLGGDAREVILTEHLAGLGLRVRVFGLPVARGENITVWESPAEALREAQAVILPAPGVNERGELYCPFLEKPPVIAEEDLSCLPAGTPLFVGVAGGFLKNIAGRRGCKLVEVLALDEVAILNSIPSAEGAIQLAMEKLPITIHGSESFVLGFGRTGATLAQLLVALGARTTVVARNPAQRARAYQMNCRPCDFPELAALIGKAEVIFNTVPALVLTEPLLQKASPQVLIIDLASFPGGVDFEAARRLGINAVLAPGLPGKVAPKTAGRILSRVIPRLLAELLS